MIDGFYWRCERCRNVVLILVEIEDDLVCFRCWEKAGRPWPLALTREAVARQKARHAPRAVTP